MKIDLERYTIGQEIGRDDFALIYQGRSLADNDMVAIKFILPHLTFDTHFADQFWDNSQRNMQLDHPNIIHTYDIQQEGDTLYMVQEWVEARPLVEVMESDGAFSPKRMLKITRQIANALDYAFEQGVIHGDLSAKNVLIGPNDQVYVANFGQTQTLANTALAKQGYPLGTPEILAPEMVQGQPASPQADLYALGILSYFMLVNNYPFQGTLPSLLHAQVYDPPRPLHLLNPNISSAVSQAVERLLTKQPSYRYHAASEFIKALTTAINADSKPQSQELSPIITIEPTPAASPIPIKPPRRASRQHQTKQTHLPQNSLTKPLAIVIVILIITGSLFFASSLGAFSIWQISQAAKSDDLTHIITLTPPRVTATPTGAPATPTMTRLEPAHMPATTLDFPTPGRPVLTADSPFTNLQLTQDVTEDNSPVTVGTAFNKGDKPIYLFFDYQNITPNTTWSHRWTWADTELATYQTVWSSNYEQAGTAWIFYAPEGGYQPGPYKVNLFVEGRMVATATFVILP